MGAEDDKEEKEEQKVESVEEIGFTITGKIEVKAPRELWNIAKDIARAARVSMEEDAEENKGYG